MHFKMVHSDIMCLIIQGLQNEGTRKASFPLYQVLYNMLDADVHISSGEQERKQLSMDSGSNLSMYHTARLIQCLAQLMVHVYLSEILHATYHQRTLFPDFFRF